MYQKHLHIISIHCVVPIAINFFESEGKPEKL